LFDVLINPATELSKINISGSGDDGAVPAITSSLGKGQSSQNLSVQICQYASDPDLLVLSHEQRGNPSVSLPLVQELPVRVENLDARVVPIGDVNLSLRVDHHIVRQAEFAGTRSSLAKLEQIFSVARELHLGIEPISCTRAAFSPTWEGDESPDYCNCHE